MINKISILLIALYAFSCAKVSTEPIAVASPSGNINVTIHLDKGGSPYYLAEYEGKAVLDSSFLGFELADVSSLSTKMTVISSEATTNDTSWEQPWGEERMIRDNYNQMKVSYQNVDGLLLNVVFRVFDNGVAYRYEFPNQNGLNEGTGDGKLEADLVPYSTTDDTKAYLSTPFNTPWRTIQLAKKPGDLITNYMILNLNEPNKLGDVSWVNPGKYIGVWWEMFVNLGTWHQGPKHAANTENVKKYIDFASEHGFNGVLVEGWNYGWDGNWMGGGTKFEFTKPYPDYNIKELSQYAKERDVYIIGHHETGADIVNYDEQLDDAYAFLAEHGMKTVKTGYVENGDTLPNGLYHHGQAFVQHFQRVIDAGAKHKTMIVAHEPIKDTGKRRTYPNMVSREGAKGQEYNAMGGNGPGHVTVLPFTRGLSGPMDYTPGVFDIKIATNPGNQVLGSLSRELALYLVILKDVPTDWETTKVLDAQIGEHLTVARQERDSENWFVGTITNEKARDVKIDFDFLDSGQEYTATVYRNSDDADYLENPTGYTIEEMDITSESSLALQLCRAGGAAISIFPKR